jgi:anti-anti-sigma regulatory factor
MFRDVGGKVIYVAPSGPVTDVISLLNLDQFLEITDSIETAMSVVGD